MKTKPNDPIKTLKYRNLDGRITTVDVGLTKRELMAAEIMAGLELPWYPKPKEKLSLARSAVEYADALIAELNKDEKS